MTTQNKGSPATTTAASSFFCSPSQRSCMGLTGIRGTTVPFMITIIWLNTWGYRLLMMVETLEHILWLLLDVYYARCDDRKDVGVICDLPLTTNLGHKTYIQFKTGFGLKIISLLTGKKKKLIFCHFIYGVMTKNHLILFISCWPAFELCNGTSQKLTCTSERGWMFGAICWQSSSSTGGHIFFSMSSS